MVDRPMTRGKVIQVNFQERRAATKLEVKVAELQRSLDSGARCCATCKHKNPKTKEAHAHCDGCYADDMDCQVRVYSRWEAE